MNSIELADELTAPIGKSGQTTYAICEQAAVTLRRQHEVIKTLREALAFASKYDKEMSERIVRQALEATKELG